MSYKLIIAEKPSVASSIAKIVGANTPHREGPCGYLEGHGYKVTWAFGHLVGLQSPSQMGFMHTDLPMFPKEWTTKILGKKDKSGKEEPDPMTRKQMKIIESLFLAADRIIVATDAGREGELIFRYIYEHLGCTTPFSRLWISSLTDEAIRNGLNGLKDGHEYDSLSAAAHARSQADWLVGFNASKALSIFSGFKGVISLGRVQTPTLGLICRRYEENTSFVPTPYWVLKAKVSKGGLAFDVLSEKRYEKEDEADGDLATTKKACQLRVLEVEKKQTHTKPPLLHDLTSLQRAANGKYGLTADETLKTAQNLYEKKYLTYPRTGSRFIPNDVFSEIPKLIGDICGYAPFSAAAAALKGKKLCRKSVNDSKVTDHHALLPTGVIPKDMNDHERKIYDLVCGRMLEAFGEDHVADVTNAVLDAGGVRYKAHGSVPVHMGWKAVFGGEDEAENESRKDDDDENTAAVLPELLEEDLLPVESAVKLDKYTKPLPIYTDSSLLGEMETCGKRIDDEQTREAMKDVGIGTPATRAQTIEILIRREYVRREKKKLLPTELGLSVWNIVRDRKISDVKTTGEWERDLAKVEHGEIPAEQFDRGIREFVQDIIEDLKQNCTHLEGEKTRTCPCCGKTMKNLKFNIVCDDKAGGCGYKVPREVAGKKLPEKAIDALCEGKATTKIKGFKSKSGKSFDAVIRPDMQTKEIKFVFDDAAPAVRTEGLICPLCGREVKDEGMLISCECGLKLWKKICSKTLTEAEIKTIMSGKTAQVHGMVSKKTGKKFDAGVRLNKTEKTTELTFNKK